MAEMWVPFQQLKDKFRAKLKEECGDEKRDFRIEHGHYNYYYESDRVMMAHISEVNLIATKNIWMMHVNVYSRDTVPMPIFGFDVVAGKNKVTGCFHDMSPTVRLGFGMTEEIKPTKSRELPDWAREIFSENMIAANNVSNYDEARALATIGRTNLARWFDEVNLRTPRVTDGVGHTGSVAYMEACSKYCQNQLKNPHSFRVMESLGFPTDYLTEFKTKKQFPY